MGENQKNFEICYQAMFVIKADSIVNAKAYARRIANETDSALPENHGIDMRTMKADRDAMAAVILASLDLDSLIEAIETATDAAMRLQERFSDAQCYMASWMFEAA